MQINARSLLVHLSLMQAIVMGLNSSMVSRERRTKTNKNKWIGSDR